MRKQDEANRLCLEIVGLMEAATEGMSVPDTFEIVTNVVVKMSTYPLSLLEEKGQQVYMDNFLSWSKETMESYIKWENKPPTEH